MYVPVTWLDQTDSRNFLRSAVNSYILSWVEELSAEPNEKKVTHFPSLDDVTADVNSAVHIGREGYNKLFGVSVNRSK